MSGEASTTAAKVGAWRRQILTPILALLALGFLANLLANTALDRVPTLNEEFRSTVRAAYIPVLAIIVVALALGAWRTTLRHWVRVALMVVSLGFACLVAIHDTALQAPNALVGLAVMLVLLVVVASPRVAYLTLGLVVVALAGMALYFIYSDGAPQPRIFSPTRAEHWLRVVPIFFCACTVAIAATAYLVNRLEREIEQSRALHEAVLQKQKTEVLGQFAAGITHDINNLLAVVDANLRLQAQGGPDHDPVESRRAMQLAIDRCKQLVREVARFARQEPPQKATLSLGSLVEDVATLIDALVPPGVRLERRIDPRPIAVSVDVGQLHHVALQLAMNARRALEGRRGVIEISDDSVELEGGEIVGLPAGRYARLIVRDDGVGLDSQELEQLFEPFLPSGTGGRRAHVELAHARNIIAQHGGAILVESAVATGTTVRVLLPVVDAVASTVVVEERRPEPSPTPTSAPAPAKKLSVLYVEDEEDLASSFSRLLRSLQCQVELHLAPEEALAAFRADPSRYDVVLTDYAMPGMSGVALAEELATIRPGIPILLVSGYLDEVERTPVITAFLEKPCDVAKLGQHLERIASDRR